MSPRYPPHLFRAGEQRSLFDGGAVSEAHTRFIPARTLAEATARLGAACGVRIPGNVGAKTPLLVLRDALRLNISATETNVAMAREIAAALEIPWSPGPRMAGARVSLEELNALLLGTLIARTQGRLFDVQTTGSVGDGSFSSGPSPCREQANDEWPVPGFRPAGSKLEAVNRIAKLTGAPPETLGPGSKEHKSVLINLAAKVAPDVDVDSLSKTGLAEALAERFGVPWSDHLISTGETIRLDGLNVLLAAAEFHFAQRAHAEPISARREAEYLVDALWEGLGGENAPVWDGKDKVLWLRDNETRQENQMEWPGWYFDFRGRQILGANFAPIPDPPMVRYGNTTFDYSHNFVWDLKCHTQCQVFEKSGQKTMTSGSLQLNDARAAESCIATSGLGFLILLGDAHMDEGGEFKAWHDRFKGKPAKPSLSGTSRVRKAAFVPQELRAYWFADSADLDRAFSAGALEHARQGRQQSGAFRKGKLTLNLNRADAWLVAKRAWNTKPPG